MDSNVDETLSKVVECLNKNENFCLDAGAGAGKTYTLIETIKHIREEFSNKKIVCITFTNNAKDEIISRLPNIDNIFVSTIHDFIWKSICRFQSKLRIEVNELIKEKISRYKSEGNIEKLEKYEKADLNLPISYRDYESLANGIISHDTLLNIFLSFIENNDFCNILFSSINYIFIDEYQDTNKKIFPEFCRGIVKYQEEHKTILLGLFGDFMQNIYIEGIGQLDSDLSSKFIFIKKKENFRSCQNIIKFNNCFRADLIQTCMNLDMISGPIKFIYNFSDNPYLNNISEYDEYKRLHLTHRIISEELRFEKIYSIYSQKYGNNTSNILKNADERFLRYICHEIMPYIYEYKNGVYNNIIKNINLEYINFETLKIMEDKIREVINNIDKLNVNDFLHKLFELNIFSKPVFLTILQSYLDSEDEEFLQSIMEISTLEYYNYYLQYSNKTMLETMHGTKGNEFDNVLINIHENTTWNWYNFSKLIKNEQLKESVKLRTEKLLYVACTRAKKSLIINYIVDEGTSKNDNSGFQLMENIKKIWDNNIEFEIFK